MATKIYCAVADCAYNNDKNVCTAKSISLSDHDVQTVWDGQRRFQRCKTYTESPEYAEMKRRFLEIMEEDRKNELHKDFACQREAKEHAGKSN